MPYLREHEGLEIPYQSPRKRHPAHPKICISTSASTSAPVCPQMIEDLQQNCAWRSLLTTAREFPTWAAYHKSIVAHPVSLLVGHPIRNFQMTKAPTYCNTRKHKDDDVKRNHHQDHAPKVGAYSELCIESQR